MDTNISFDRYQRVKWTSNNDKHLLDIFSSCTEFIDPAKYNSDSLMTNKFDIGWKKMLNRYSVIQNMYAR